MVSIEEEEDKDKEELTTTEAMSEKMCEELEAMQSLTHEEIVEKILALKKSEKEDDEEELENDDVINDADDDDLTGHEGTKFAMIIAQGMRASLARQRLKKEIERRDKEEDKEEVSASDETFLKKLRKKVYQNWKPDMPSLQRDVDEQRKGKNYWSEEKKKRKRKSEASKRTREAPC
jgi:hypothetical protein